MRSLPHLKTSNCLCSTAKPGPCPGDFLYAGSSQLDAQMHIPISDLQPDLPSILTLKNSESTCQGRSIYITTNIHLSIQELSPRFTTLGLTIPEKVTPKIFKSDKMQPIGRLRMLPCLPTYSFSDFVWRKKNLVGGNSNIFLRNFTPILGEMNQI